MIATLLTMGNLLCGLTAILAVAVPGLFGLPGAAPAAAIWCMVTAGVLDALDGPAARRLGGPAPPWGREFDALADLVSFGIAPAVLLGYALPETYRTLTLPVCAVFVTAGAWRLARFLWSDAGNRSGLFEGLPITGAGLTLAAIRLFEGGALAGRAHPRVALVVMVVLAALMVSRIPYRRFPVFLAGSRYRWVPGVLIAALIAVRPWLMGLTVAAAYLLHGPLMLLIATPAAEGG